MTKANAAKSKFNNIIEKVKYFHKFMGSKKTNDENLDSLSHCNMDKTSILFAKIAGLKQNFETIDRGSGRVFGCHIEHLLPVYEKLIKEIKESLPELYSDLPDVEIPKPRGTVSSGNVYNYFELVPLIGNLGYILEVRANSRIGERELSKEKMVSIFISHGRSKEWYKIQSYVERDLHYSTIELAQQPNLGRSVLQKLNEEASKCNTAIILMTGEDIMEDGEVRARENVLHEIGFFQGKLGLEKVILLHEEGVNIPSNIHGLVYIPFPKDTAEAVLGALTRELKVTM